MQQLRQLDVDDKVDGAQVTTGESFGTRFNAFRSFESYADQVDDTSLGMIIWPGGTFAEVNSGLYGFQHEGLFDPDASGDRPGLAEIFSFAEANGMAVSVVLPTAIYQDDPETLKAGATSFFEDVYSGKFGPLPDKLIFEIGNEYYDVFDGDMVTQSHEYAAVVNSYSDVITDIEGRFPTDPDQVRFSLQLGKSEEANDAILEVLDEDSLLITDLLTHHRFVFEASGAGNQVEQATEARDDFNDAIEAAGGEDANLYLSAYNTASLTRNEAAQQYLETHRGEDVDLGGRGNLEFEQFYQDKLDVRDHGLEHGENILQIFSEYQPLGVEAAGVYGWDTVHAARSSLEGTDGEPYIFAGGATQDMMAESLIGTTALDWYQDNDHRAPEETSIYGFDSADKLVIFLAAPEFEGDDMKTSISLTGLGETIAVWGESLTAETPENWHELFDIPDTPGVDQSPEAETFAVAQREEFTPELKDGSIQIEFSQPGEIVRLTFARTEAGKAEIEEWHGGAETDLSGVAEASWPTSVMGEGETLADDDEPTEEEAPPDDDGGGGFPVEALLIGLLLPLLMGGI
ncbi:hypothetical protein N9M66_04975 [Litoreibacter sp.]|nr:hypothetical protein [Litoreibacter sp.]